MLKINLSENRDFHVLVAGVLWKVCPLNRSEERALLKKHTTVTYSKGREVEKIDDDYFPVRANKIIKGFSGLVDEGTGNEIPYSTAIVSKLCELYPNMVLEVLAEATSLYAERVEEEGKNSERGASGKA